MQMRSDLVLASYCVAGVPKMCGKTYIVVSGDYCSLVESKNSITDAALRSLNPWLDAKCGQSQPLASISLALTLILWSISDFQVGQVLCVAAA